MKDLKPLHLLSVDSNVDELLHPSFPASAIIGVVEGELTG